MAAIASVGMVAAVLASLRPTGAAFVAASVDGSNQLGTTGLVAPSNPACAWAGANTLTVSWTNANGSVASGHTIERSSSSGSGFASIGTTAPASVVTAADNNPVPPTLRYYRVAATVGNWTSAYTAELVSSTCAKSIVAFAGGGASSACSYSGAASGLALSFLPSATLGNPSSSAALAVDASGNIYVADTQNNCVRKIDPAGNVTRVAGGGATATCGTTTATGVKLSSPQGVAVDSSGNVYIADSGNNCVRKVSGSSVTKVAGGGATSSCGTTTAANVSLSTPTGIAVDGAGDVFVGDNLNRCVRKVDTGGTVTAFLGTGSSGTGCAGSTAAATSVTLAMVDQITVDASNNVYVADGGHSCIYKVAGGTATRLVGSNGTTQTSCTSAADPSTAAYSATYPSSVAVDGAGDLFYTLSQDSNALHRSCIVKRAGSAATLIAGTDGTGSSGNNGPAIGTLLNSPASLALAPNGDLYVADIGDQTIRRIITP